MSRTSANFAFSGPAMSANFPSKLVFGLSGEGGSDGGEVRELVHEATTEEVSCVFVYTGFRYAGVSCSEGTEKSVCDRGVSSIPYEVGADFECRSGYT